MANNQTPPAATDYSGVREYIGARYVPVFANPAEWTNTRGYEPLTIVLHEGNSYTSTQYVPTGIDITNTNYWLETGNWNAQIEAYRKEVLQFDGRITQNEKGIQDNMTAIATEVTNRENAINSEATARSAEDTNLQNQINALETSIDNIQINAIDSASKVVCIGDSLLVGYNPDGQVISWGSYIQQCAGFPSANLHIYANSGSGFVQAPNGVSFQTLLERAHAELADELTTITHVIIGGGINDVRSSQSYANMQTAATLLFNNATSWFPNANLIIAPMLCANGGMCAKMRQLLSALTESLGRTAENVKFIPNAWTWNYDIANRSASDGIHLTGLGEQIVAHNIIKESRGCDCTVMYSDFTVTNTNGNTWGSGYRIGSSVYLPIWGRFTTVSPTGGRANTMLGVPFRYGCFTNAYFPCYPENPGGAIGYDRTRQVLYTQGALSNSGCYTTLNYQIEAPI